MCSSIGRAPDCGSGGSGIVTRHLPKYVIQTRCRSGLQNLDGWVRFLDGVQKMKYKKMKTKMKYKQ